MSKRFGRNRRRKMREEIAALKERNATLGKRFINISGENSRMSESLMRVSQQLHRFSLLHPNPDELHVSERVWQARVAIGGTGWDYARHNHTPYRINQELILQDCRSGMSTSGFPDLFNCGFFSNLHHVGLQNPVVFVPHISPFAIDRSVHFAVRDMNTGLVVNYAVATEALFTVPRIDLIERVGSRLGELAVQALYEKFNVTTHADFLKALAEANDPMRSSHKLSGRGVIKDD